VRVNGKIRAREVRVIGVDGKQLGILSLGEAINLARANGVDLVEIAANATPPVCRLVDFGKFRYEQAKKDKESKKHQHANKVKEIQLSPKIDPHDLGVKLSHAIDFLCEEMKVKVVLKFRGREMAHTEFGFQLINKFLKEVTPYGHPDSTPKLVGRAINLMLSPLPRNKRAKNPREAEIEAEREAEREEERRNPNHKPREESAPEQNDVESADQPQSDEQDGFTNSVQSA
ncbi:MAG: translation initiation factor, partial [Pedosphaera sp.]|nr:translation initiation factor [Pedosphaera sp.]